MKTAKHYKGEKYIYLLMGYMLAKDAKNGAEIGEDTNYKGGFNYQRRFSVREYNNETILTERKGSAGGADYTRSFVVYGEMPKPIIRDYIAEDGDNYGQNWIH